MIRLALLLLAIPRTVLAQDTTRIMISGTVVDPLRKPLEGVEIRIPGTSNSVLSSPSGTFRLWVPRAAEVLFQLRFPGYNSLLLKTSSDWAGTVVLQPGAFELPEIQVTARYAKPAKYAGTARYDDYFRRRRQGIGEFIDQAEIDLRYPLIVADVLRGRAGIRVTGGNPGEDPFISFARCNEKPPRINVYVDGRKLIPIGGTPTGASGQFVGGGAVSIPIIGEMLSRVSVRDVEFMEIFRGPSELPPEFNDGNCGAIAIWTRSGGS